MLFFISTLTVFLDLVVAQNYGCGTTVFYGPTGSISSPNYPSDYPNYANCTYNLYASNISSIYLTFSSLSLEPGSSCPYDYVEVSCRSHSVRLPTRYCGTTSSLGTLTFSPCAQVTIKFKSDGSATYGGFMIRYLATPIECLGNCTPISNSFGYVCPCDNNETNVTMPTMNPDPQCPGGCTLNTSPYLFCICLVSSTHTTQRSSCGSGCRINGYDFYGNVICDCSSTSTTSIPCAFGCYLTSDWWGDVYCNCPDSTNSPISCPSGCYQDADYWGTPFCNCPPATQPPIWCSPGCTSDTNIYGDRYCRCPTTTALPCYSPCYISYNYTYDIYGLRYCYCPPTTTLPPPTGCNQTLTSAFGFVTSPNYPNAYPMGTDCYQYISVPMATSITIRLIDINIYYSSSYNYCQYEYVQITGCDGSTTTICSSYTFPTSGLTLQCIDSSVVTVLFHSYSYYYYYSSYSGFKLAYTAGFTTNCSDSSVYVSKGNSGTLTSPNYPNNFPGFSECFSYVFTDDDNLSVRMNFEQFRLGESSSCGSVFLKLVCLDNDFSQTLCGSNLPAPVSLDCGTIQIWFKSNASSNFSPRLYKITYHAVAKKSSPPPASLPPASSPPASLPPASSPPASSPPVVPGTVGAIVVDNTGLPESTKLGIGLGVGIGGFFLIILVVFIIVLIANGHRQSVRAERYHMENLAVICKSMNARNGPDSSASVGISRYGPSVAEGGFENPLAKEEEAGGQLPRF